MVAYIKTQQRKQEERERLRVERGQIKFIYLRCERVQVVRLRETRKKARRSINCMFLG